MSLKRGTPWFMCPKLIPPKSLLFKIYPKLYELVGIWVETFLFLARHLWLRLSVFWFLVDVDLAIYFNPLPGSLPGPAPEQPGGDNSLLPPPPGKVAQDQGLWELETDSNGIRVGGKGGGRWSNGCSKANCYRTKNRFWLKSLHIFIKLIHYVLKTINNDIVDIL